VTSIDAGGRVRYVKPGAVNLARRVREALSAACLTVTPVG
jgi:hypothetical protein